MFRPVIYVFVFTSASSGCPFFVFIMSIALIDDTCSSLLSFTLLNDRSLSLEKPMFRPVISVPVFASSTPASAFVVFTVSITSIDHTCSSLLSFALLNDRSLSLEKPVFRPVISVFVFATAKRPSSITLFTVCIASINNTYSLLFFACSAG